ncbi:MAG: endonuclease III domain-containing protein [SAR324 cluster bacterium]|nr:endonuclease III domain-containing protein [SAR324 cluster bacterium]
MIATLNDHLLKLYGPRGWWPISLFTADADPLSPNSSLSKSPYHIGDYSYPKNDNQRLEIAFGAILTQNTNWTNVTKALGNIFESGNFSESKINQISQDKLGKIIKSAGYFNQKSGYLKNFCAYLAHTPFSKIQKMTLDQARGELLGLKGLGPETADCILLYACGHVSFVIDAYTQRFLMALGLANDKSSYQNMQKLFTQALPPDLTTYQELHALLVTHGKYFYSKKPYGISDPLLHLAKKGLF